MNTTRLNNGLNMPLLGFGVFQITDEAQCKESVLHALKTGYRMIDILYHILQPLSTECIKDNSCFSLQSFTQNRKRSSINC